MLFGFFLLCQVIICPVDFPLFLIFSIACSYHTLVSFNWKEGPDSSKIYALLFLKQNRIRTQIRNELLVLLAVRVGVIVWDHGGDVRNQVPISALLQWDLSMALVTYGCFFSK